MSSILLGEYDLTLTSDCHEENKFQICEDSSLEVEVEQIFIHEKYRVSESGNANDIAVIKTIQFVEFTNFIKPICLPRSDDEINVNYGSVIVAGFGKTDTKKNSEKMQKAEIDITNHMECARKYRQQGRTIHETQLCAARGNSDSW